MAKGRCPNCDELVGLSPTGEKQHPERSSEWWRIDLHRHPTKQEICEGSGKRV